MTWDFRDEEWYEEWEDYQVAAGQDAADRHEWELEHEAERKAREERPLTKQQQAWFDAFEDDR